MTTRITRSRIKTASPKEAAALLAEWRPEHLLPNWRPREGYLISRTRAISARVNQNYDAFPSEELKKAAHTFLGKPVFVNHHNEDPTRARGVVVAARYVESGNDKYIEVLQEVDAKSFPKLAHELITGGIDSVSMGTEAAQTKCSICANVATDMTNMCDHILFHKGSHLPHPESGKPTLVFEKCSGLGFFELSYVFEPADETAVVSHVLTASRKGASMFSMRRKVANYDPELMGHFLDHKGFFPLEQMSPADQRKTIDEFHQWTPPAEQHDPGWDDAYDRDSDYRMGSRHTAYGEVEAPNQVDTLRGEGDEDDDAYHHYVESPAELRDPDLDEAKRIDRVQDEDPDAGVDEDAQEDPGHPDVDESDFDSAHDNEDNVFGSDVTDGSEYDPALQGSDSVAHDHGVPPEDEIRHDIDHEPYPESLEHLSPQGEFMDGGPDPRGGQDERFNEPHPMRQGATTAVAATRNDRNNRKTTMRGSNNMARQTLATRGATRRRAEVENDQGIHENSGEFAAGTTPGEEAATKGSQMKPGHDDVSSIPGKRTDPQQASKKAAREFRAFVEWVRDTYGVTIQMAASDNKLRTIVQRYAAATGANVSLLMPGVKSAIRQANMRTANPDDQYAGDPRMDDQRADEYDRGDEDADPGHDIDEGGAPYEDTIGGGDVADGDEYGHHAGGFDDGGYPGPDAGYQDPYGDPGHDDQGYYGDPQGDPNAQDAPYDDYAPRDGYQGDPRDFRDPREAKRKRSDNRRRADNMEHAKPLDRVKVVNPVSDVNPERSQKSQYEVSEFANNAGDDKAKPDLSTDQNWYAGEHGKKKESRVVRASGAQAVRLAEAYIEAGIAAPEQRWKLAGEFEQVARAVVADRTALLERVIAASKNTRRVAGAVPRRAVASVVPPNLGNGARTRVASANDPANDMDLFL